MNSHVERKELPKLAANEAAAKGEKLAVTKEKEKAVDPPAI